MTYFENPLSEIINDTEHLADVLQRKSAVLREAIREEAIRREEKNDAEEALQERITELLADAILRANAGDKTSPLYKIAATSKAWGIIAENIPLDARKTDKSLMECYARRKAAVAAYERALADLEQAQTDFRATRTAADLTGARMRAVVA